MTETPLCAPRQFKHPLVRDLAWILASPSLLQADGTGFSTLSDAWFHAQYKAYEDRLTWLDKHPEEVEQAIGRRALRLGHYVEALIAYWLTTNNRYQLVKRNLPIRHQGKTLGELDCIVRDRVLDIDCHWEIAAKFYLGMPPASSLFDWVGPQGVDCLQHKVTHLFAQQIERTRNPICKQQLDKLGIDIKERRLWVKGRLYYPTTSPGLQLPDRNDRNPLSFVSKHHLRGIWASCDTLLQFAEQHPNARIAWSKKSEWMGAFPQTTHPVEEAARQAMCEQQSAPRAFILVSEDQERILHGFVVSTTHQCLQRNSHP